MLNAEQAAREQGATMPEYAFMVSLIALVCFGAVLLVGAGVNELFLDYSW